MINRFSIVVGFILLQIFSLSIANGEMSHDSSKDLAELLKDENESEFFTNQKSGSFHENFLRKSTLVPANNILIKEGTSILLTDSLDREYSTILVEGNLKIKNTGDSALKVQKIIIGPTGSLTIGTNENPIDDDKKVQIVFKNENEGEVGIFVFGKLWIHGKEVSPTFVGLQDYAKKSDKRLVVDSDLTNWKRDDVVIITSAGDDKCNEVSKISKIVNQDILLQNQLTCSHTGISNTKNSITSHVALLSRNIIFSSEDKDNRGSVNFFHGSTGYIKYAQFDMLGPKEVLGRYPIHFHHLKDSSRGIEVIGNSITNSDNRWITIHDSNGILVKNNVGYISQGHGFFLEEGTEFDNVFEKNIGIITKSERIRDDGGSSIFWTMNPMNVFRENVAVNAQYWGFFFDIENDEVDMPISNKKSNLRSLPSIEFENNIAYNSKHGGMKIIRPIINENEAQSSEIMISNFQALGTKQETEIHFGIQVSGSNVTISNSSINNYKFGIYLKGENNKVLDTEIKMDSNFKPDSDISGIIIAGSNNWIENSEIGGYISKNNNDASDISISNNQKNKRLLSAKIVNTTLLDIQPFYFGSPANEKSFLEIYGYDTPHTQSKKLPENFILKKIGSDKIEQRGEYNNLEFNALIKMIPETLLENRTFFGESVQIIDDKNTKLKLIKNFKNNAFAWSQNNISDKEFMNEVEILYESGIVEFVGIKEDSFKENEVHVPYWAKKLVGFWFNDSISEQEFFNALEYIINSNLSHNSLYN